MPFEGPVPAEVGQEDAVTTLLRQAAAHLSKGWCQKMAIAPDGLHVCASGAVYIMSGRQLFSEGFHCYLNHTDNGHRALNRLDAIANRLGYDNIVHMNDAVGMTKERILSVFAEAIGD